MLVTTINKKATMKRLNDCKTICAKIRLLKHCAYFIVFIILLDASSYDEAQMKVNQKLPNGEYLLTGGSVQFKVIQRAENRPTCQINIKILFNFFLYIYIYIFHFGEFGFPDLMSES